MHVIKNSVITGNLKCCLELYANLEDVDAFMNFNSSLFLLQTPHFNILYTSTIGPISHSSLFCTNIYIVLLQFALVSSNLCYTVPIWSLLFRPILFNSVLFRSVRFRSVVFRIIASDLIYSVPICSLLFRSVLFWLVLFYSDLFYYVSICSTLFWSVLFLTPSSRTYICAKSMQFIAFKAVI